MLRTFMIAKIHGAVVTRANRNYSGSLTLDAGLMKRAGMMEFERVQVLNLDTGARVETYLIRGKAGSGVVGVNGAAAHLFKPGQRVLVVAFAAFDLGEIARTSAKVLIMDGKKRNRVKRIRVLRLGR